MNFSKIFQIVFSRINPWVCMIWRVRVPGRSFMMTKFVCTLKFLWRQTTNIVKLTRIELTFRRFLRFPERHRFGVWRLNFEFDARLLSWNRLDPKIRGVRRTRLTIRSIPSDRQNFFCFQAETMHRSFCIRLQAAVNGYKILTKTKELQIFRFQIPS